MRKISAADLMPFTFWSNIIQDENITIDEPIDISGIKDVQKLFYILPQSLLLDAKYNALIPPISENRLYATTPQTVAENLKWNTAYKLLVSYDADALLLIGSLINKLPQIDLPPFIALTENQKLILYLPKPLYEIVNEQVKSLTENSLPLHQEIEVDADDIQQLLSLILEVEVSNLERFVTVDTNVLEHITGLPNNLRELVSMDFSLVQQIVEKLVVLISVYGYNVLNALIYDFIIGTINKNLQNFQYLFEAGFLLTSK